MFKEYDTFDVALALYHWLQHNWSGQTDKLYRDFCILTAPRMFKPGISDQYFDNISEDVKEIYDILSEENYSDALDVVLNYEPQG